MVSDEVRSGKRSSAAESTVAFNDALPTAIYTSEFLHRRTRARIKPVIEMMASLPSVVLGFLAALVIAPIVERFVPGVLFSFLTVPLAVLFGAYLWRLVPRSSALRLERYRLWFAGLTMLIGLTVAFAAAPAVEGALFGGDIRGWLDGRPGVGSGATALFIALVPLVSLVAALVLVRVVNPILRRRTTEMSERARSASATAAGSSASL